MNSLANDYLTKLLAVQEPPCLSLYQPTHRHHPENQQDPIRFRNLLKSLEDSLQRRFPEGEVQPLLAPFRALAGDRNFWNHTLDGLAVLGAPGMFQVYQLQRPVAELAVVANSFHIKPLIRILQSADRYQVLGLNRQEIRLFEGNRDALDEVELAQDFPRTITEALGKDLTEPHITVSSHGTGAGGTPMRHGHGSKKDEVDIDTERFFRAVDRAILERYSKPSGLPLLLAALPEYHTLFRQISHNPLLMHEGIDTYPDALPLDALRERAWSAVEPRYHARLAKLVDEFLEAKAKGIGADTVAKISEAAVARRVATLLIEADRQVPGRINTETGGVELDSLLEPDVDDLLDDVAEIVLKAGGHVVIVPAERMPTQTGIAAIYRF